MSQLFVIGNENRISKIYDNLEKAKQQLKNIYDNTPDYKHYGYKIMVYNFHENEYIISNITYTYKFDTFSIHSK